MKAATGDKPAPVTDDADAATATDTTADATTADATAPDAKIAVPTPGEAKAVEIKPVAAKSEKTDSKNKTDGDSVAALTGSKTESQTATTDKPVHHAAEDAVTSQDKPGVDKEIDKSQAATPDTRRTTIGFNLTNAAPDAAQQAAANTAAGTPAVTAAAATQPAAATAETAAPNQSANTSAVIPLAGIAVEIATHAKEGKNRFEIRLDPPDLGRIDVRLEIDKAGNVTSRLVVERTDTLDLLRRDQGTLERALNDAGLKMDGSSLQFSLRDQNAGGNAQRENSPMNTSRIVIPADVQSAADAPLYRGVALGGLDISV